MPNGGMKPCCQTCQWAAPTEKLGKICCERHQLTVFLSLSTFCTDLSKDKVPGLAGFIARNQFKPETIYQWIEIGYRDTSHPDIPKYYEEPVDLALLSEYATWNEERAISASQSLHEQKRKQLLSFA
jgi:hypothetical protein